MNKLNAINTQVMNSTATTGNDQNAWISQAITLLNAAEPIMRPLVDYFSMYTPVISERPEEYNNPTIDLNTHCVAIMLYGFSIECLLNAYYLSSGGELYVDGRLQPIKGSGTHSLRDLCSVIDLADVLSKEHLNFLEKISLYLHIGRYPQPNKFNRWGTRECRGGVRVLGVWTPLNDEKKLYGVITELFEKLKTAPPQSVCVLS